MEGSGSSASAFLQRELPLQLSLILQLSPLPTPLYCLLHSHHSTYWIICLPLALSTPPSRFHYHRSPLHTLPTGAMTCVGGWGRYFLHFTIGKTNSQGRCHAQGLKFQWSVCSQTSLRKENVLTCSKFLSAGKAFDVNHFECGESGALQFQSCRIWSSAEQGSWQQGQEGWFPSYPRASYKCCTGTQRTVYVS